MRQRAATSLACLIALASLAGCASTARKQHAGRAADADALFARACYTCLSAAFDSYDALRRAAIRLNR